MAAQSVEDAIIALIGSGQARTRADIVKRTGLAASTISAAVSRLVDSGVINETEESVSTGGRRARMLIHLALSLVEEAQAIPVLTSLTAEAEENPLQEIPKPVCEAYTADISTAIDGLMLSK